MKLFISAGVTAFLLIFMTSGCAEHVPPPPSSPGKPAPLCATDASSVWVCTEEHVGTAPTIYIRTYDVMATKESFDPRYRFAEPELYQYSGHSFIPADLRNQSIPVEASLKVKDGNVFWHWSKAQ